MKRKSKIKFPEIYQGMQNPRKYFEGWYFRHTSQDKRNSLIVIPGISYSKHDAHAFIQVITGIPQKTFYIRYDVSDFQYSRDTFYVQIGRSSFSDKGIHLEINDETIVLSADLSYGNLVKIDSSPFMPNIMGYFAYIPFMECNHGVISLSHTLSGSATCNGTETSYDSGTGYIEKDWGTSFPQKYIWLQSNHFHKDTSLFLSIARIPFAGMYFNGLISILAIGEKQYRFATYNRSFFKIVSRSNSKLQIELKRKNLKLVLLVNNNNGHVLKAPRRGRMSDEIQETLDADVNIRLYEDDTCIYEDDGTNLGYEMMWDDK